MRVGAILLVLSFCMSGCGSGGQSTPLQNAPTPAAQPSDGSEADSVAPVAVAEFHVRFPGETPLTPVLRGEISSEGPSACHGLADIWVGPIRVAKLARFHGRCSRAWRPLVLEVSGEQRRRVRRAAHRLHAPAMLHVRLAGAVVGHRPEAHLRFFTLRVHARRPRNGAGPTRVKVDELVDGAFPQTVVGSLSFTVPWQRTTQQDAMTPRFTTQPTTGCRASTFVDPRTVATRLTATQQATPAQWDHSPVLARGSRRGGAWTAVDQYQYTDGHRVSGPREIYGIAPIRVAPRRYLQVRTFTTLHGTCSGEIPGVLLLTVERILRTTTAKVQFVHHASS